MKCMQIPMYTHVNLPIFKCDQQLVSRISHYDKTVSIFCLAHPPRSTLHQNGLFEYDLDVALELKH